MNPLRPAAPVAATHLPVLDGLRGLTVLFIPLIHYRSFDNGTTLLEQVYLYLGDCSLVALDVFFALSGFLITGILLDTKGSPSYFRGFYARRILRIIPLYYTFLLVYFILVPRIAGPIAPGLDLSARQQSWYWDYLLNVGLALSHWWHFPAAAWAPDAPGAGHLWSLSVEEQFYLLWPLIVSVCSPTALRWVGVACLIVAPVCRLLLVGTGGDAAHVAAYALTPARLEALAIGSLVALRRRQPGGLDGLERSAWAVATVSGLTFLGVIASTTHMPRMSSLLVTLGLTASAYVGGAIVLLSLQSSERSVWHRALRSWPMRQIGQYSYAIYILHYPIWYLLGQANWLTRPQIGAWIPTRLGGDLVYWATLTSLSIVAAAISWHTFEKHFLALRRYVPYAFEQRASERARVSRSASAAPSTTPGAS